MKTQKKKKLDAKGWKIGNAKEFLGLTPEESAYIDIKLKLSEGLKQRRQKKKMTQQELAKIIKSSQSRIAKMEAGDPSVSIDLLVRSLLVLKTPKDKVYRILN